MKVERSKNHKSIIVDLSPEDESALRSGEQVHGKNSGKLKVQVKTQVDKDRNRLVELLEGEIEENTLRIFIYAGGVDTVVRVKDGLELRKGYIKTPLGGEDSLRLIPPYGVIVKFGKSPKS